MGVGRSSSPAEPPGPCQKSSQRSLHFLIPQGVDEGIEGGGNYGIEKGDKLSLLLGVAGRGLQVHVDGRQVEEADHHQVGGAGPKGLVPSLGGLDPEYRTGNEAIGEKDESEGCLGGGQDCAGL